MPASPSRRCWSRHRRRLPHRASRRRPSSEQQMKLHTQGTAIAALVCAGAVLLTAVAAIPVARSTVTYETPAVTLVREDGKRVSLARELDDGRPVLLNFIFTTCSSICPLTSRTLEEFQHKLGSEAARVHLMSISIDPEQDTPARSPRVSRHSGPSTCTGARR